MNYLVKVGLDYLDAEGDHQRREPGDVASDLPAKSIGWLAEQGLIEALPEAPGQEG